VFPQKTGTNYQIGRAATEALKEDWHLPRRVLTIAIEMYNIIIAPTNRVKKSGLTGGAVTEIKTMTDNNSSAGPGRFGRIIAGTIINHQDIYIRVEVPELHYQITYRPGFIKDRDQNQNLIL